MHGARETWPGRKLRKLGLDGKKLGDVFSSDPPRARAKRESVRALETSAARGIAARPAPFGTVAAGVPRIGLVRREIATSHQNLISDAAEELTAAAVRAFNHPGSPCTRTRRPQITCVAGGARLHANAPPRDSPAFLPRRCVGPARSSAAAAC
jgi:hypothetical protein